MTATRIPVAVLRLGRIVGTVGVTETIPENEVLQAIQRHQAGGWANLEELDRFANDQALSRGGRVFSAYNAANGARFWIITEADRSVTTALLPKEY